MRSLLPCLFLMMVVVACSKHSAPTSAKNSIIGRWRLVKAVGGFAGTTIYPPKDSVCIFSLNSDSTWQTMTNARTTGSGTFASIFNPGGPANPLPTLVFTPPHLYYQYTVTSDTLVMHDPCCDLYVRTYVRY
ncbi:MAG: hypothetical protein JST42_01865 [Bacteroidetes bacterium]|nr:hypothetical protein [Bacteroidota bacterium]